MSFLDKIADAVVPAESDEDRMTARRNAEGMAAAGGWLDTILEHHRQIEAAFSRATASQAEGRRAALKDLALLLTGHSNAEESVIYPELAAIGEKADAGSAFEEQAMAKIEMAELESLDPLSDEWLEKLGHIQGAVQRHVYHEESSWFPKLQQSLPESGQAILTDRYNEEYARYVGEDIQGRPQIPSSLTVAFGHSRGCPL
jgi:hemerythrin superfamily protein